MTQNQINFARLKSEDKHKTEDERIRWAGHFEGIRQFGIVSDETHRHNVAQEVIGQQQASAATRQAAAAEKQASIAGSRLQWEKNTYLPNYVSKIASSPANSLLGGAVAGAAAANATTRAYNKGLLSGVSGAFSKAASTMTDFITLIDSRLLSPELRSTTAKKGRKQ